MKKNNYWILIAVLVLSLSGLILFQAYWIHNAIEIKKDQFDQQVNAALDDIVQSLQKQETAYQLVNEIDALPADSLTKIAHSQENINQEARTLNFSKEIYLFSQSRHGRLKARISVVPGDTTNADSLNWNSLNDSRSDIKNRYQKSLTNKTRLVENVVNKLIQSHLRIEDRIEKPVLEKIIRSSLLLNGIKIPYEYAIKDESGNLIMSSSQFIDNQDNPSHVTRLFPDDIFDQANFFVLTFDNQKSYILHSMALMLLLSILLTILIISSIAISLYIILKQKRLSDIKSDFVNNMTHELKTPISTISLASQMLNDVNISPESKNINHLSKLILDESKRLGQQVEKVLQMAVFDKAQIKLKKKKTNVNLLIENIITNYTIQLKSKDGKIFKELNALDPYVYIDEMHFTNTILNLFDNAIKYCQESPILVISTRNNTKGIFIEVKDNGIGINKENLKKIFEQFYRVPTGNLHNVKGFGLGLNYVKKITEIHGGYVSVDSKLGHGSVFTLFFPFNTQE